MNMRKCHHFLWQYVSIIKEEHKHTQARIHSPSPRQKNSHSALCVIPSDLTDALLLEASSHSTAYPSTAFELSCQESVTPRASFFDFQE